MVLSAVRRCWRADTGWRAGRRRRTVSGRTFISPVPVSPESSTAGQEWQMFAGEMRDRGTFAAMCPARRRSIEAAQDGPVGKVRATRGLFGADWNVDAQTDDYRSRGRCPSALAKPCPRPRMPISPAARGRLSTESGRAVGPQSMGRRSRCPPSAHDPMGRTCRQPLLLQVPLNAPGGGARCGSSYSLPGFARCFVDFSPSWISPTRVSAAGY
jgi:hypothetical protein